MTNDTRSGRTRPWRAADASLATFLRQYCWRACGGYGCTRRVRRPIGWTPAGPRPSTASAPSLPPASVTPNWPPTSPRTSSRVASPPARSSASTTRPRGSTARHAMRSSTTTARATSTIRSTTSTAGPTQVRSDATPNQATRDLARCLQPLLDGLPPAARDALIRVDLEGQTQQQAAEQLGISVSGMKSRVQRSRRQLKELLERCCTVQLDRAGAVSNYHPNTNVCGCATSTSRSESS